VRGCRDKGFCAGTSQAGMKILLKMCNGRAWSETWEKGLREFVFQLRQRWDTAALPNEVHHLGLRFRYGGI
jgi:hypothetical protein